MIVDLSLMPVESKSPKDSSHYNLFRLIMSTNKKFMFNLRHSVMISLI